MKIEILWSTNFYDGPLAGVCFCDDEPCYFKVVDDSLITSNDGERYFNLFALSVEQYLAESDRQRAFNDCVNAGALPKSDFSSFGALPPLPRGEYQNFCVVSENQLRSLANEEGGENSD